MFTTPQAGPPPRSNARTYTIAGLSLLAAGLIVSGTTVLILRRGDPRRSAITPAGASTPSPERPAPAADPPAAVPSVPLPPALEASDFPQPALPDPALRGIYLADLDAISADIVHGQPDTAIARGIGQCASLRQFPDDRARQISLTGERFTSPAHPEGFGAVIAEQILAIVHARLCPTYPLPPS